MDHGRRPGGGRGGTTQTGDRDVVATGVAIPVLLLPEGVLLEGLDAALLTNAEFDPATDEGRRNGLVRRIAASMGRVWHRQWEF